MEISVAPSDDDALIIPPLRLTTRVDFDAFAQWLFDAAEMLWPSEDEAGDDDESAPSSALKQLPNPLPSRPSSGKTLERPTAGDDRLTDAQRRVLDAYHKTPGAPAAEIADRIGMSVFGVGAVIGRLRKMGLIN